MSMNLYLVRHSILHPMHSNFQKSMRNIYSTMISTYILFQKLEALISSMRPLNRPPKCIHNHLHPIPRSQGMARNRSRTEEKTCKHQTNVNLHIPESYK